MSDENIAIQTGNIVANPDLKPVSVTDNNGNKVTDYSANFTLAVNKNYKDRNGQKHETTMYSNIHRFLRTQGQVNYYKNDLTKGKHIAVIGAIKNNNYKSAKTGMQYSYQLIPSSIKFLSKKPSNQN